MPRKLGIQFRKPEKIEVIGLSLAIICFAIFDQAQNFFRGAGDINAITPLGLTGIFQFWVFIILYHLFLVGAIVYSFNKRGTHWKFDIIFGTIAILGTYFLVSGAIAGVYFISSEAVIPWFFNVALINQYHWGVIMQVIAWIWFMVTE